MPASAWRLDSLDVRLLACLQQDARQTHDQLGRRIGLSSTAVLRRLRRLRAAGIIEAEVAVIDPASVGIDMTAIVHVTLRNEAATNRGFGQRLAALPAVSQCYYVTGRADLTLIAHFADMAAFQAFIERHLDRSRDVRRFDCQLVLRTDKRSLRLPL